MFEILADRAIYIPIIVLMMIGLYIVVATGNLVKRLVGLSIFQTTVGLLYIAMGKVFGGQPPILVSSYGHGDSHGDGHGDDHGAEAYANGAHADAAHAAPAQDAHETAEHAADHAADAGADHAGDAVGHVADAAHYAADTVLYSNPLPHVLILTAIVVGVATLAVGLSLVVRIREAYGTIEDTALTEADYAAESGGRE